MKQQELIELIKTKVIRLYEDSWLVERIKQALTMANGDIDRAIEIAYDELNLDVWSGSYSDDTISISLTGKTCGFVAYWTKENPDHFFGEPDIRLDNREIFTLVRDGTLATQETLF